MTNVSLIAVAMLALAGCASDERTVAGWPPTTSDPKVAPSAMGPAATETSRAIGRIGERNLGLNAVIAVDPTAMDQAARLDAAGPHGPLSGKPILIKDNIEVAGPLPTTAGSLALKDNVTGRDAPLVARLRAAGMIIVGKANFSEWANIRSNDSISGWSAVGGQTRNPYALDRNPCGSSSGSGAAVGAGLIDYAIGTETNGSITCPASVNGIVGLKPSVGLVSRTHIVPISATQDTAGPMTRTVRQAAELLTAIAGSDPARCFDRRCGQAQGRLCCGARYRCAEGQAARADALRRGIRHERGAGQSADRLCALMAPRLSRSRSWAERRTDPNSLRSCCPN